PAIVRPHPPRPRVTTAAQPEPPPAPDPAPAPPAPEPAPPAAPPPMRPEERAFADGWNALRSGDAAGAAARFAAITEGDPLGEDAAYWSLVARARAGAVPESDLRSFLDRFPGSPRRGEVHLMLGLRQMAAGDEAGARLSLGAAAADPSP